jgi:ABC-type nitrate/sulfonate/bicarbonate transport system substrate-binding protein
MKMKGFSLVVSLLFVALVAGACGSTGLPQSTPVKFMLDWVPNTNHTGVFVARDKGYFEEAGLDVQIIEPGEVYPEAAVAGGAADFGISFQESVTLARAEEAAIVSVAAVLQHNTSGFASLAALNVTSPADFEGLRYGAWGAPSETPTLKALMECSGADFSKLDMVTTGFSDPLALISEKQVDLVWIYYGWQGIQAKEEGMDLNVVMMKDYVDCVPDFYTPVVITSESTVANRPEIVKALLEALSRGYTYAAEHPDEAADILLAAVPELDSTLVKESQRWLSDYYIAEAPRWGEQKESVWQDYADWMVENDIVRTPIAVEDAFTNQFLP